MRTALLIGAFLYLVLSPVARAQELSDAVVERRKQLEADLATIEKEISTYQVLIDGKRSEAASLQRDISILDAQIKKTKLEMQSLELIISKLSAQIKEKEQSITHISSTIDEQKLSLAESIKKLHEYDDASMVEVMLSNAKLSDYFNDVDAIDVVQDSLQKQFFNLRSTRDEEVTLKNEYAGEREEQVEARALLAIERQGLESKERERQKLLKDTKGVEATYQKVVTARRRDATTIRAELFKLQGSAAISFEKAVLFAERASASTGVRVAFILGILAQETDLGRNIGQCNLPTDPPQYRWQAIMKPSRDIEPYKQITAELGLDPEAMPLSCPQGGGWGGAMGPAQFIPSTWQLMKGKIAALTGHNPPNPWDPEDAFMASAVYLGDLGASTVTGEREAAGRYFAGGNWNGSLGRRYASQVLEKAAVYQEQINIITASVR